MMNMDQNKLAEVINQFIITQYMQNIFDLKSRIIKLYTVMPYTGAPNISDAQNIAIIEDMKSFVLTNCRVSCN